MLNKKQKLKQNNTIQIGLKNKRNINQAKEFSQHYVGESILSYQVIDQEDALYQCDADNEHYAKCDVEQKLDLFFTRENEIGYQRND